MDAIKAKMTIFFQDPFWVAVYERECDRKYEVCKIIFGAEPKDYEVYEYVLKNFYRLKFSPMIESDGKQEKHVNPKRMRREINRQLRKTGAGTKAQQALKLEQEQGKMERKKYSREMREAELKQHFELRQKKRKDKHRGH